MLVNDFAVLNPNYELYFPMRWSEELGEFALSRWSFRRGAWRPEAHHKGAKLRYSERYMDVLSPFVKHRAEYTRVLLRTMPALLCSALCAHHGVADGGRAERYDLASSFDLGHLARLTGAAAAPGVKQYVADGLRQRKRLLAGVMSACPLRYYVMDCVPPAVLETCGFAVTRAPDWNPNATPAYSAALRAVLDRDYRGPVDETPGIISPEGFLCGIPRELGQCSGGNCRELSGSLRSMLDGLTSAVRRTLMGNVGGTALSFSEVLLLHARSAIVPAVCERASFRRFPNARYSLWVQQVLKLSSMGFWSVCDSCQSANPGPPPQQTSDAEERPLARPSHASSRQQVPPARPPKLSDISRSST